MISEKTFPHCLVCDKTSEETPLLSLLFSGESLHICAQHLPILIHHPEKLSDKIKGFNPPANQEE